MLSKLVVLLLAFSVFAAAESSEDDANAAVGDAAVGSVAAEAGAAVDDMPQIGSVAVAKDINENGKDAVSAPVAQQHGTVRVIASGFPIIDAAENEGCEIIKNVFSNYQRKFAVMNCPEDVAYRHNLREDKPLLLADTGANALIGANLVHSQGNTGRGTKIAMIDTGMDYTHPELRGSYLGGYDFANNDPDPMDEHGHGTVVAGVMVADGLLQHENPYLQVASKYSDVRGVAPSAGIYALKVWSSHMSGFIEAIYWAIDGPDHVYGTSDDPDVDVITASVVWGNLNNPEPYCNHLNQEATAAIKYANQKGVPFVSAAGNGQAASTVAPGCISHSIAVGAVDKITDLIASFSPRGNAIDIVAPGTHMKSTALSPTWGYISGVSGTSVSAPVVAGTIALIKKEHPDYTVKEVKKALRNTAVDKGANGFDYAYGWGRVNAYDAVYSSSALQHHTKCTGTDAQTIAAACVLVAGPGADECQSHAECICSDSDGGIKPNERGNTSGMYNGEWNLKQDICSGDNAVIEYSCSGRGVVQTLIACTEPGKELCIQGRCTNPNLPDIIAEIQAPSQMIVGVPAQVTITTANQQTTHPYWGSLSTAYFVNAGLEGIINIPQLTWGLFNSTVVSITCTQAGNTIISAYADYYDEVVELNEENNEAFASVNCVANQNLNQDDTCPILPTEVDCGNNYDRAIWYDEQGCPYKCKVNYGKAGSDEKDDKAPVAGEVTDDIYDRAPSSSSSNDNQHSDSSDSLVNSLVADGDFFARAMILVGVYLEKFKKP